MSSRSVEDVNADSTTTPRRLSSDERREQILLAAIAVFGARGYVGTTTDEVARAAGVSQPYVVRLFGSKENLFLGAMDEALDRLMTSFRAAIAVDDSDRTAKQSIGDAYVELLSIRGLHQTLAHSYLLGGHPVIGPAARAGFTMVWRFFREEAGLDAEQARMFLAEGMLISTMIGLRLVDDYGTEPEVDELFLACFPSELRQVLDLVPRGKEPW
ncbi:TetR family transcriptional regulator [Microbacterium sp. CH12i]|uniref:TetR/AcrR family transcriptional regulator n=1 Tax=Microbacterium sp. CH12i TaxID=1479651 RepID=UPI0004610809|nr:TetR/AcrR family transcriptional regulator [Microbacterium sp. CH12i]KDA07025.1 TetR family transcriptional regulator [Microbacterium sp. CH12i]